MPPCGNTIELCHQRKGCRVEVQGSGSGFKVLVSRLKVGEEPGSNVQEMLFIERGRGVLSLGIIVSFQDFQAHGVVV